jgi:prepilin-type N-terminal cleavage/methylation domain-containing protein
MFDRHSKPRRAFTLLEILVAMSIFTLVMVSIFQCWKLIVSGTQIGEQAAASAQRARTGILTIQEALQTAQMSLGSLDYYTFEADTSGKFAALAFTARLPDSFPGSSLFGDSSTRRVTFQVERGEDNKNNLVMTQWPLLVAITKEATPYPIVLARDVSVFNVEFWSDKEKDWVTEFVETNQLPKLMRVALGVGYSARDMNRPQQLVTRVVAPAATVH